MGIVADVRRDLDHWIGEMEQACSVVGGEEVARALREDLEKAVGDPRIRIVVCGEWSTGKSALINALVGKPDLLPIDVNPCSSYVTVVEYAPEPSFTVRREGKEEAVTHDQFLRLTAAREADPTIVSLRVGSPDIWPGEEVVLVDTPGLEDLDHTRAELTLNYLPSADVVILVLAAPTGVRGTERTFVRNHLTSREIRRVIVALNKIDLLNEFSEVGPFVDYARRALSEVLPDAPVLPVSALGLVRKWNDGGGLARDGGIAALKAEILKMVHRERVPIIRRRFALPTRQRLEGLKLRIQAEEAMLGRTLADAEQALVKHRKETADTMARVDDLFREARNRIRADLNPWFHEVPDRLNGMVRNILKEVEALPDLSAVRAFVNDRVLDRRVAVEFRQLCHEFETRMMETVRVVGQEGFASGLRVPSIQDVVEKVAMPEVRSFVRHLPEFVVNIAEAILLNPLVPGGFITAILARLGLDKILEGIPLLPPLLPANRLKNELVAGIRSSLADVPEQAEAALREAAEQAMKDLFQQIRSQLDRQVAEVEAGLEEARITLSREKASVEARKAELAGLRLAVDQHAARLESLVS